ncbi:wax ester/triacylglycerol synthase family O-acyltransferase [Rugosimonospora africana]|nr:wax ester/triacylglycerol synthase family O-acyltransferase [Rugosimonospora africana]
MSILDAGLLRDDGGGVPMHAGTVAVFDGPAPTYLDLVRLLLARLSLVPRYRQRVRTVPLGLGRPAWVDDEHFQVRYHLRHAAVPAPGGAGQLRDLAGRVFAQRLDATRPLWELWLVEGLRDDRWALITKTHLGMVDGVTGADLTSALLDALPDRRPPAPRSWIPAPTRSTAWHLVDGVRDALAGPAHRLARTPAPAIQADRTGMSGRAAPTAAALVTLRRLASASTRALNGPIGPDRRWEWADVRLADVTAAGAGAGAGAAGHAVVLAAVTRGLRDLLAGRGELSRDRAVRALVPVAVPAWSGPGPSGAHPGLPGVRVRPALVNLPVGEPDPVARLARIRDQLTETRGGRPAVGARVLAGLPGFAAPTLVAMGARLSPRFPQSAVQAVVTNVPGPGTARYLLGRRMVEIRPYVPVAGTVRISVGVISYLGRLYAGVTGDFGAVPDLGVLRDGVRAGVDELAGRARDERTGVKPPGCPESPPRAPTGPD